MTNEVRRSGYLIEVYEAAEESEKTDDGCLTERYFCGWFKRGNYFVIDESREKAEERLRNHFEHTSPDIIYKFETKQLENIDEFIV